MGGPGWGTDNVRQLEGSLEAQILSSPENEKNILPFFLSRNVLRALVGGAGCSPALNRRTLWSLKSLIHWRTSLQSIRGGYT